MKAIGRTIFPICFFACGLAQAQVPGSKDTYKPPQNVTGPKEQVPHPVTGGKDKPADGLPTGNVNVPAPPPPPAPIGYELTRWEEIPKDGHDSWTLFLVCAPDWVMPDKHADLANLYRRFKAFGDVIGERNAAVWFWKEEMRLTSTDLAQNLDAERSGGYCRELGLHPSKGPFIVVTTAYPDSVGLAADRMVYSLGQLPPAQIAKLLNGLTDQLVANGPAPPAGEPGFWIRFLIGAQQSIAAVGCAVTLEIDTGLVSAEVKGCKQ